MNNLPITIDDGELDLVTSRTGPYHGEETRPISSKASVAESCSLTAVF
jgi:hypothetical protein